MGHLPKSRKNHLAGESTVQNRVLAGGLANWPVDLLAKHGKTIRRHFWAVDEPLGRIWLDFAQIGPRGVRAAGRRERRPCRFGTSPGGSDISGALSTRSLSRLDHQTVGVNVV